MKIVIEAQGLFGRHKTRHDRATAELISGLQKTDTENQYYVVTRPGPDKQVGETHNFRIIELSYPTYPFWEQIALPSVVRDLKPDLLHCTYNTAPLTCRLPILLHIHQAGPEWEEPWPVRDRIYMREVLPVAARRSRSIVTDTHYDKEHIRRNLHIPAPKIEVLYEGIRPDCAPKRHNARVAQKYGLPARYILTAAPAEPMKNFIGTIRAYMHYNEETIGALPLVVWGLPKAVFEEILYVHNALHLRGSIHRVEEFDYADLPYVYSMAELYLLPYAQSTLAYTVLEAMACGTPVVTADSGPTAELAGKAEALADGASPDDTANALARVISDDRYREALVRYGINRAKEYGWDRYVSGILKLYENIHTLKIQ